MNIFSDDQGNQKLYTREEAEQEDFGTMFRDVDGDVFISMIHERDTILAFVSEETIVTGSYVTVPLIKLPDTFTITLTQPK